MNNVPHDNHILRMESKTFSAMVPNALFEWHMQTKVVFVILPREGSNLADGVQIAANVKTPTEAKQAVAAYAQGYAHGLEASTKRSKALPA